MLPNLQDEKLRERGLLSAPEGCEVNPKTGRKTLLDEGTAEVEYFDYENVEGWSVERVREEFGLKMNVSLVELLTGFFFYFGYSFDFWTKMVSIKGNTIGKFEYYKINDFSVEDGEIPDSQESAWNSMSTSICNSIPKFSLTALDKGRFLKEFRFFHFFPK